MRTVVVVSVGGTIASTADASGVKTASVPGAVLAQAVSATPGPPVRVVDAGTVNSFAMTFGDLDAVRAAIHEALADPSTCGVVVTHGTDTLEETAMAVDIDHTDPRPVVFTGSQRSWDDPETDAVSNLNDAVAVASAEVSRNLGVLVCFGNVIHAARGTRKVHNSALQAFYDVDNGPIGMVSGPTVRIHTKLRRIPLGYDRPIAFASTRVDTVAIYPGVDRVAIDANVAAGADGIVLQATGYGNANRAIVAAVDDLTGRGVPVVLSSRVSAGPVRAVYGNGGGADLVAAGAIPSATLRPSQARVLLAALCSVDAPRPVIESAFAIESTRYRDTADEAPVLPRSDSGEH